MDSYNAIPKGKKNKNPNPDCEKATLGYSSTCGVSTRQITENKTKERLAARARLGVLG
jgi:hypothetical protein